MNTYTICIPCVDKHIEIMEKILTSLKHFTVKPDKVIASISPRYLNLDLHSEKKRLEEKFPFLLCLVQDNITGVGENINYTFQHVDTDYVTIWGADDFYHPQYFEIMNYVIKKCNPSIITHSFDGQWAIKTPQNPKLLYDINVFEPISLKNMTLYNDLYLVYQGDETSRFYSKKYMVRYQTANEIWMHAGMQTIRSDIIKANSFKVGPMYDYKSDTLFLNDIFRKYSNMVFIDENMVQYTPSNTCTVPGA